MMLNDLPPLRAAVLLSKSLCKAPDDASRKCIVLMLHEIRRSISNSTLNVDKPSKLGRRILKALGDQRLNGPSLARLCCLQYSGRFRGELKTLVDQGRLEKAGGHYTQKCPDRSKTAETSILIKPETT